jgi:3',5'-cyclic AMP phosphodiesterase CpdA
LRIAQITDFHFDDFLAQRYGLDTPRNFENLLGDVVSRGFDRLVLTGDFGVPERHWWLADQLRKSGLPFDVILGNHDKDTADQFGSLFDSGLLDPAGVHDGEYFYSLTWDGVKVLFLDTALGRTSEAQKHWLRAEIPPVGHPMMVFAHHPILDCGTAMDSLFGLKDRDELAEILLMSGRPCTVFSGHYHASLEAHSLNVRQFVTPACVMQVRGEGTQVVSDSFDYGYRSIEISGSLRTENHMLISPRKLLPGE